MKNVKQMRKMLQNCTCICLIGSIKLCGAKYRYHIPMHGFIPATFEGLCLFLTFLCNNLKLNPIFNFSSNPEPNPKLTSDRNLKPMANYKGICPKSRLM